MKKPKKPQSAETADAVSLPRRRAPAKRGPKGISDETIETAVIAAGGKTGIAAKALGVTRSAIRKRIAARPSMKGLSAAARAEFRRLLKRNVFQMLQDGNERVTIELMKTKVGRELGFAPDAQKVELTGKVDGDLRLGPLDERAAAERLKALEEARQK